MDKLYRIYINLAAFVNCLSFVSVLLVSNTISIARTQETMNLDLASDKAKNEFSAMLNKLISTSDQLLGMIRG